VSLCSFSLLGSLILNLGVDAFVSFLSELLVSMETTRATEIKTVLKKSPCARSLALAIIESPGRQLGLADAMGAVGGVSAGEGFSQSTGPLAKRMIRQLCVPQDATSRVFTYARHGLFDAPSVSFAMPLDQHVMDKEGALKQMGLKKSQKESLNAAKAGFEEFCKEEHAQKLLIPKFNDFKRPSLWSLIFG
jgi:hypothetical protein